MEDNFIVKEAKEETPKEEIPKKETPDTADNSETGEKAAKEAAAPVAGESGPAAEHSVWDEEIADSVRGYREGEECYVCSLCGRSYEKGRIYPSGGALYDAFGAVKAHGRKRHGDTADYLLGRSVHVTGLGEMQKRVLQAISGGMDDKTIAKELGIAASTVRSHRYKLREKERQARLFVALMEALEAKTKRAVNLSDAGVMEEPHETATMVDERYHITDQDRKKTLEAYFDENGALTLFPSKEKKKIIVLRELIRNFVRGREYSEKDVNLILGRIYQDYATLRRSLVEYGFFDRSDDGTVYRVKE